MKKMYLVLTVIFAALVMMTAPRPALALDNVSTTVALDALTNYVWRGQQLTNDRGVLQPWIEASHSGFTANLWANEDLENTEHTETDLTLSYEREVVEKVSVTLGYIYYALDGADDTQELYISAAYDIIGSPSITYYGDPDEGRGGFLILAVGHSLALPHGMTVNGGFTASVNFQNALMGLDKKGNRFTNFYNGEVSASLSVPVTKHFQVEPKVAWTFPFNNVAKTAIESVSVDNDSSTVYGGLGLSYSF